jgi:hypothetical protein
MEMATVMVIQVSQRSGPHEKPFHLLDICSFSKILIPSFTGQCRLIYSGLLPHFLFTLVNVFYFPKREMSVGDLRLLRVR